MRKVPTQFNITMLRHHDCPKWNQEVRHMRNSSQNCNFTVNLADRPIHTSDLNKPSNESLLLLLFDCSGGWEVIESDCQQPSETMLMKKESGTWKNKVFYIMWPSKNKRKPGQVRKEPHDTTGVNLCVLAAQWPHSSPISKWKFAFNVAHKLSVFFIFCPFFPPSMPQQASLAAQSRLRMTPVGD